MEFAPDPERSRYSELESAGSLLAAVNAANPTSPLELSKAISSAFSNDRERRLLAEQLQECLLDLLFNSELHAYGYRIAPSRSGHPTRIASDLFEEPELDWEESRLIALGLKYENVKILDPQRIPHQAVRPKGRIGSAVTIRETIKQLKNSNADFCCMSRKDACNAIRERIGGRAETGLGLSNKNLMKYILEVCPKRSLDNY